MMGDVDVSRSCIQMGSEWKRMVSILGVGVPHGLLMGKVGPWQVVTIKLKRPVVLPPGAYILGSYY